MHDEGWLSTGIERLNASSKDVCEKPFYSMGFVRREVGGWVKMMRNGLPAFSRPKRSKSLQYAI